MVTWKEKLHAKEEFSRYCNLLYARHLVTGVGGNLSARIGDRVLLTPTGYSLRDIAPGVIVVSDMEGNVMEGGIPTKDSEIHLGIMRFREDIHVVCHVHGAYLVALSALVAPGKDVLPPITPGFAYMAHPLTMVPFMVPGSRELTEAVVEHFRTARSHLPAASEPWSGHGREGLRPCPQCSRRN